MKGLLSALVILFVVGFMHTGCQKLPVKATNSADSVSAIIDSGLTTATGGSVGLYKSGSQLVIKGITSDNITINITLTAFNGFTGSTIIDNYACYASIINGGGTYSSVMNTGIVNITATFPYLKGTYYFQCANPSTLDTSYVTHGRFSVAVPTN